MKKLILLLFIPLVFTCSSDSTDDNSNQQQTPNNSIIIDGNETILKSAFFNANLASEDGGIIFHSCPFDVNFFNSICEGNFINFECTDQWVELVLGYEGNNHGGNIGIPDGTYITDEDWSDDDGTTRFDVNIFKQGEYNWIDDSITGTINITRNAPSTNINPYANYTISWEFIGPNGETITGYYNGDIYMCIE